MDNDCLLEVGVPGPILCVLLACEERADDREIFGLRSLSPLDGESAENRWCEVEVSLELAAAAVDIEVAEAVDDFRSPNDSDSLFLRGRILPDAEVLADICRGTREVDVDVLAVADGEFLADVILVVILGVGPSDSITPNSLVTD